MKPTLYLETTIPSYLTAKTSKNILRAEHQRITRTWWKERKPDFELFVSDFVIDEARKGNSVAAHRRMEALKRIPLLAVNEESILLAEAILVSKAMPPRAAADAAHVAIATFTASSY